MFLLTTNHNSAFADDYATPPAIPFPGIMINRDVPTGPAPPVTEEDYKRVMQGSTAPTQPSKAKVSKPTYQPGVVPSIVQLGYKVPNPEGLDINVIDYKEDGYSPNEPLSFSFGAVYNKMSMDKENGFFATAMLTDLTEHAGRSLEPKYNKESHLWTVNSVAPEVIGNKYEINLIIYCGKKNSPCVEVYGGGMQVNKQLQLQVH